MEKKYIFYFCLTNLTEHLSVKSVFSSEPPDCPRHSYNFLKLHCKHKTWLHITHYNSQRWRSTSQRKTFTLLCLYASYIIIYIANIAYCYIYNILITLSYILLVYCYKNIHKSVIYIYCLCTILLYNLLNCFLQIKIL